MQSILPQRCPQCESKGTLVLETQHIRCRLCGYRVNRPETNPNDRPPPHIKAPKRHFQPSYALTHIGPIDLWARAAYNTGQDYIRQEKWDDAIKAFYRALDSQADFIDAHLWIARLHNDESVQRDHLTSILAHQPNHIDALRELMILDGKISPEGAARIANYDEPNVQILDGGVAATVETPLCPRCRGRLTTHAETGRTVCAFCGYDADQPTPSGAVGSLIMALLEKRAQPIAWVIQERVLHCNQCGAERTLPGDKLSSHCLFCGSTQVIIQDALSSFREPDAVIPFRITRKIAANAIQKQLNARLERLRGLFDKNRVERAALHGIYLPFWSFDSVLDVHQTTINKGTGRKRIISWGQSQTTQTYTEMYNNLAICAVHSPPPALTAQLDDYDWSDLIGYDPKLLSEYSAELYTIDFDKASLEARGIISRTMRQRYDHGETSEKIINVSTMVRQMTFRLLLLPVWIGTLLEEDGDIRLALVNGQTGKVALGRAEKRPK